MIGRLPPVQGRVYGTGGSPPYLPRQELADTAEVRQDITARRRSHHSHHNHSSASAPTPAQKDEVVALFQQGVPVREICQRYGISKQQVSEPSQSFQPHRRCAPGLCKARGLGWLRGPTAVKRGRRGSRG